MIRGEEGGGGLVKTMNIDKAAVAVPIPAPGRRETKRTCAPEYYERKRGKKKGLVYASRQNVSLLRRLVLCAVTLCKGKKKKKEGLRLEEKRGKKKKTP